jgi:hypothetical protein
MSGGSRRTEKHAGDEANGGRAEGEVAAFLETKLSKCVFDTRSCAVTSLEPKSDHGRYELEKGGAGVLSTPCSRPWQERESRP